MAAAAGGADPDDAVPTCPEWTVRDLIRHTGGVHRWATGVVAGGRTEPPRAGPGQAAGTGPTDEDLADWLGQGCADLVTALVDAPDDLQCWTFLAAPSPRAMWARRQAHETAVHRVDAQLAAGIPVTSCAPAFAADGIDELLMLFVPRRGSTLPRRSPGQPGGALHRRRRLLAGAHGLRRGDDGAHHGRRRRGLRGQRDGGRSLPGAVEPNGCARRERGRRPRRAGPVLRGGTDPLARSWADQRGRPAITPWAPAGARRASRPATPSCSSSPRCATTAWAPARPRRVGDGGLAG